MLPALPLLVNTFTQTESKTGITILQTHSGWNRHYYPHFKDEKECKGLQVGGVGSLDSLGLMADIFEKMQHFRKTNAEDVNM